MDGHDAMSFSRFLIVFGVSLVIMGVLWPMVARMGLWHLPGDLVIERGNMRIYIPVTTSLAASAVVSAILYLLNR